MVRALIPVLALVSVAAFLLLVIPDDADAYSFEVKKEYVEVFIKKDGSIDIHYVIEFANYGEMDGVDIGLPNRHYDEDSAVATIFVDGRWHKPDQIHKSPYVEIGLAVEFKPETANAVYSVRGDVFRLDFTVNNPHMVYVNE